MVSHDVALEGSHHPQQTQGPRACPHLQVYPQGAPLPQGRHPVGHGSTEPGILREGLLLAGP